MPHADMESRKTLISSRSRAMFTARTTSSSVMMAAVPAVPSRSAAPYPRSTLS